MIEHDRDGHIAILGWQLEMAHCVALSDGEMSPAESKTIADWFYQELCELTPTQIGAARRCLDIAERRLRHPAELQESAIRAPERMKLMESDYHKLAALRLCCWVMVSDRQATPTTLGLIERLGRRMAVPAPKLEDLLSDYQPMSARRGRIDMRTDEELVGLQGAGASEILAQIVRIFSQINARTSIEQDPARREVLQRQLAALGRLRVKYSRSA